MFHIRPFKPSDEEYARDVEINNALWPDEPNIVENLKYDDETRNEKYYFQRLMIELVDRAADVEQKGNIIGVSWCEETQWSHEPGKYSIGLHLDPEFAHLEYGEAGVAQAVMSHLLTMLNGRSPAPKRFTTVWREDKLDRINFLKAQGFKPVMRWQDSELDVIRFDPAPFLPKIEQVEANGIKLYTLPELQAEFKDWMERMYDMDMEIAPDEPMAGEFTPQPIEEYAKMFKHPAFLADGWFIAVDEGRCVAVSNIWDNKPNPKKLYTGFTGVRRSHRRKGVATALKVKAIEYVRQRGATGLITGNEENNPMYQINVIFGFKPKPAWVEFHKDLNEQ